MIVRRSTVNLFFVFFNFIGIVQVFFTGVNCLQITDFLVPLAAKVGEDRQLSCQYQLGSNETLYFLRWYKDGNEFFRYMPKETPAQRVYNVSGVRIKTLSSTSTNVVLTKVEASTSGLYRCEVSAEAPGFETADREAHFNVIDGPKGLPFVTVSKVTVDESIANETIVANCSGMEGIPAPQLSWSLASIPVPNDKQFVVQWVQNGIADNLKRTTSMLILPIDWIIQVVNRLERSRALAGLVKGSDVVLPLICTSHILGLFEESDKHDIRVIRNSPTTWAPSSIPGSRVAIKLAKSATSINSSATGLSTRHGAFTNVSSNITTQFFSRLILAGFILMFSSTWSICRSSF
ncbi:uncharacterized protein LOC124327815 [Daphnia pulicaria]|uniref:uncharacterized protein LOC124327815 n=1 Tax=Daphnia pulicaria TaxID=35523 RepID=UPI001EECBB7A|nr:uncharacterized protein LOC124327815 [Daphnia pulicaria]